MTSLDAATARLSLPADARAALVDFQDYLSDRLPPLSAAHSMELLLRYPPQLLAWQIHAWTVVQYRQREIDLPVSDFLFHSIRKIRQMREFELLPGSGLDTYLATLQQLVLELCPIEDRELLAENIGRLDELRTNLTATAALVHRQPGSGAPLASMIRKPQRLPFDQATGVERFSRLMHTLERNGRLSELRGNEPDGDAAGAMLANAMTASQSPGERDGLLERLKKQLGIDARSGDAIRMLGAALPEWIVSPASLEDEPLAASLDAIRRVVTISDDKKESAQRFLELVRAAIDQFNAGSLFRAVAMIRIADRICEEKRVDPNEVRYARASFHRSLDEQRLREVIERPELNDQLVAFIRFFEPFRPEALLADLEFEPKRSRRRFILTLLECYGAEGRAAALARLEILMTDIETHRNLYFVRNLVYLLNRTTRDVPAADAELELIDRIWSPAAPAFLVRETIQALAASRHPRAETILARHLEELERFAADPSLSRHSTAEIVQLVDRTIQALGRIESDSSLMLILEHAIRWHRRTGGGSGFALLASHDLSSRPLVFARLHHLIRSETPRRMLGFTMRKETPLLASLVEALGASRNAETVRLLTEIRERSGDLDAGRAAASALRAATRQTREDSADPPSGEIGPFSLPHFLQRLLRNEPTGRLELLSPDGTMAVIALRRGRITSCSWEGHDGRSALFQLFDLPARLRYTFIASAEPGPAHGDQSIEIAQLITEAIQRHGAFAQARLLVPDRASLEPTGVRPQPHPDEIDPILTREVWLAACSGAPPVEWQSALAHSWRARRLLAHWTESGALRLAPAGR